MNFFALRGIRRLLSICLASGLLWLAAAASAQAQVVCQGFSMPDVTFGSFVPFDAPPSTQGYLSFQCYNTSQDGWFFPGTTYYVSVCLHMGTGTTGGANWNPRVMTTTSSTPSGSLQFQVYNGGTAWGSRWGPGMSPVQVGPLTLPPRTRGGATTVVPGYANFTANVMPGQATAIPGNYINLFNGGHTEVIAVASTSSRVNCAGVSASDNVSIASNTFDFIVSATVRPSCLVTTSTMDFGAIEAIKTGPFYASSVIKTRCTNTTAYQIALEPRGTPTPSDGKGTLRSSSTALSNPDTFVRYGLYRDAGTSQAWGNVLNSNTQRGIGNGSASFQEWTVYGRIDDVNVIPDSYSDTVTVKVYY